MLKRTLQLVFAGLLMATVLVPGTSNASHGRGAIYVGRARPEGRIELRLSDSGREVDFRATSVPGDVCTFSQINRSGVAIEDHSFSSNGVRGSFTEEGEASGTIRVRAQGCFTGLLEWTATKRVIRTLSLSTAGSGGGRISEVTGDTSYVLCANECTKDYADGSRVVLKATPNATSKFVSWSGACSGTDNRCTVTMNSDKSVTATFVAVRTLEVFVDGTGTGSVSSAPAGIDCPSDCAQRFELDESVELTPTPGEDSFFTGWTGACEGTGPCVIEMDAREAVIATFDVSGGGPTVPDYQGFWTGTTSQEAEVGLTVLRNQSYNIAQITISWEKSKCGYGLRNSNLTNPLEIEPDGTFSQSYRDGNARFTIAGSFTSDTEVSGTLEVPEDRFCGPASITWSATKT